MALWLYKYRENTLLGTPGSFAKLKFICVRLSGEGTSNELFFSVTKLKANLTNFTHSCCGRASQEELVLLDASHKIKAAHEEPGPEVMDTHSFPTASHPAVKQKAYLCLGRLLPAWRPDLWSYRRWAGFIIDRAGCFLRGQEWDCRSEGAVELGE